MTHTKDLHAMNITQNEFDHWREVVRLAYQDADTAAQLIASGEVQRGADRAHAAAETLQKLETRMNWVWSAAVNAAPSLSDVQ